MLVPSPPSLPTSQLRLPDVDAATSLATLDDQAASYARASKAENTIRSYRVDLADFQAWCDAHALPWLPATPKTIALYVTSQAQDGRKVATLEGPTLAEDFMRMVEEYVERTYPAVARTR